MKSKTLAALVMLGALCVPVHAADTKELRRTIGEIADLVAKPGQTPEDRRKMVALYAAVRESGLDSVPVIEDVLKKGTIAEKKAALYLVSQVFRAETPGDESDMKALAYYAAASKDASADVRQTALQLLASMRTDASFGALKDVFASDPDPKLRSMALGRLGFFRTAESNALIDAALNDPDETVRASAKEYKAQLDIEREVKAQHKAAEERKAESGK